MSNLRAALGIALGLALGAWLYIGITTAHDYPYGQQSQNNHRCGGCHLR
jgi:hypothetical protein